MGFEGGLAILKWQESLAYRYRATARVWMLPLLVLGRTAPIIHMLGISVTSSPKKTKLRKLLQHFIHSILLCSAEISGH